MITSSGRHFRFSPWPIVLSLGAIALAMGVFVVTQNVQRREAHVAELNRQLLSEQQTLRVLDAEWAYLTRPQRLESLMLVKTENDVMPPSPTPITTVAPVAQAETAPAKIEPAAGAVEKSVVAPKKSITKASVKIDKPAAKKLPAHAPMKSKMDDAWHIAPKKSYAPQRAASSSYPARAGIARPILE